MIQNDTLQNNLKHLGGLNMRERGSFSYKVTTSAPDLKEQIRELKAMEDSPYWNRSEADIAGMILLKYVPKEISKHERQAGQSEG